MGVSLGTLDQRQAPQHEMRVPFRKPEACLSGYVQADLGVRPRLGVSTQV
jgi:hypothetical protein